MTISRFSFTFPAPRHQDYSILQVFVPLLLIMWAAYSVLLPLFFPLQKLS